MAILSYDAQETQRQFSSSTHTCPVCYDDDIVGSRCVRLACGHFSCEVCFSTHVRTSIDDGNFVVHCVGCTEPLPIDVLRVTLGGVYLCMHIYVCIHTWERRQLFNFYLPFCFSFSLSLSWSMDTRSSLLKLHINPSPTRPLDFPPLFVLISMLSIRGRVR